jgi:hypothetical protein
MLEVLLSPVGIAVTAIVGLALVAANLIDLFTPDKPELHLYERIKRAKRKGRWE